MEISGRAALVTGAGRRLGKALALALARHGARLIAHYHESDKGARDLVEEVRGMGGRAVAISADLRDPAALQSLTASAAEAFGGLAILVNSAAIMQRTPFGHTSVQDWDEIMALNLRAPFLLSQAAAPNLRAAGGAIVNIADLAAFETWPGYIPHGISKAGLVQMTRMLARVLAPDVRVNAIAPGTILLPEDWDQDAERRLVETTPLQRLGSVEDVTSAMLFLLEADYITGETIIVDGGRHIRR